MTATILDTQTGERRDHPHDMSVGNWSTGNFSCDCNRSIPFHPLPDGIKCGSERFLIVNFACTSVEREELGDDPIQYLNCEYPDELLRSYQIEPSNVV